MLKIIEAKTCYVPYMFAAMFAYAAHYYKYNFILDEFKKYDLTNMLVAIVPDKVTTTMNLMGMYLFIVVLYIICYTIILYVFYEKSSLVINLLSLFMFFLGTLILMQAYSSDGFAINGKTLLGCGVIFLGSELNESTKRV